MLNRRKTQWTKLKIDEKKKILIDFFMLLEKKNTSGIPKWQQSFKMTSSLEEEKI